jgi:hypothetical protein
VVFQPAKISDWIWRPFVSKETAFNHQPRCDNCARNVKCVFAVSRSV